MRRYPQPLIVSRSDHNGTVSDERIALRRDVQLTSPLWLARDYCCGCEYPRN